MATQSTNILSEDDKKTLQEEFASWSEDVKQVAREIIHPATQVFEVSNDQPDTVLVKAYAWGVLTGAAIALTGAIISILL